MGSTLLLETRAELKGLILSARANGLVTAEKKLKGQLKGINRAIKKEKKEVEKKQLKIPFIGDFETLR